MHPSNPSTIAAGDVKQTMCIPYSTRRQAALNSNGSSKLDKMELGFLAESSQKPAVKRRAETCLAKDEYNVKRFALGNLTNAETSNALGQKTNKVSMPATMNLPAMKLKGASKMLTRAAMRREEQRKQLPTADDSGTENKPSMSKFPPVNSAIALKPRTLTSNDVVPENIVSNNSDDCSSSSSLLEDFSRIRVTTEPRLSTDSAIENRQNENERERTVANKPEPIKPTMRQVISKAPLASKRLGQDASTISDKKIMKLIVADKMHQGRVSSDLEQSDDSLYVSAIDGSDEESSSSSERFYIYAVGGKQTDTGRFKAPAQATGNISLFLAEELTKPEAANVKQNPNVPAKPKEDAHAIPVQQKKLTGVMEAKLRKLVSTAVEANDETLYMSAIDAFGNGESTSSVHPSKNLSTSQVPTIAPQAYPGTSGNGMKGDELQVLIDNLCSARKPMPPGVEDFDKSNWNDIYQVSEYAQDIFDYLRAREASYIVPNYMERQPHVTRCMRALLVDWMIETQESFELNHETLYLSVKIVDTYLSLVVIQRDVLQLVAMAAMLIASKYDERSPPTVDDFVYICDGAYERPDLLKMERTVFRTIGFDLGHPLSYRFLRRYARANRSPMITLTLARYILEASLMDYGTVCMRDSKLACAALFLALRMTGQPGWNETLEYYAGYKAEDFKDEVVLLNNGILTRNPSLKTVHQKYSHELFFHVAKIPVIRNLKKLFKVNTEVKVPAAPAEQSRNVNRTDADGEN